MSVMLTARSRVVLVLVVAALLAVTGYTARAGSASAGKERADTGQTAVEPVPEIGTALKMVRHSDGTVTTTES